MLTQSPKPNTGRLTENGYTSIGIGSDHCADSPSRSSSGLLTFLQVRWGAEQSNNWPIDPVSPIAGATFKLKAAHFPGAERNNASSNSQGLLFVERSAGLLLIPQGVVLSVVAGEVIRVDHDYIAPEPSAFRFWTELAGEPGFPGANARGQLRAIKSGSVLKPGPYRAKPIYPVFRLDGRVVPPSSPHYPSGSSAPAEYRPLKRAPNPSASKPDGSAGQAFN